MGVFGTGLYAGDFAMDLRSAIGAVLRLPFDPERLSEILCETEPGAARDPNDEDHTTFWLVTADQFAKRGIISVRVREQALSIIDSGADLDRMEKRGMDPAGLTARRTVLAQLRQRIVTAAPRNEPRATLKKPQPYLMNVGEAFVYPTFAGRCRNPYFASVTKDRMGTMAASWKQTHWSALVLVDRGRAFDFLAWYRPITLATAVLEKPLFSDLRELGVWRLARPGTCSRVHFQRLQLEKLGTFLLDNDKLRRAFPGMRPGTSAAIRDICISNGLSVAPYHSHSATARSGTSRTVTSIEELIVLHEA
jgi:hypothetical protein